MSDRVNPGDLEEELRQALSSIDPFITHSEREKLQLLAACLLEDGMRLDEKTPAHSLCDKLETKYSTPQRCVLMSRMLKMADVKLIHVQKLPSRKEGDAFDYTDPTCPSIPDFAFYEMMIYIVKILGAEWKSLAYRLTNDERGMAVSNISSPVNLFLCLIRTNTISPDDKDKSRAFLAKRLDDIGYKKAAKDLLGKYGTLMYI